MLNARGKLWVLFGILFVLLITPAAFAQQSDTDKIIQEIHRLEKEMLKGMNESEKETRAYIDVKFDELNTKFNELNKDVAVLSTRLNLLQWIIAIIGAPFLISIVILFVQMRLNQQNSAEIVSRVVSESTSEAATENRDESEKEIIRRHLRNNRPSKSDFE